MIHDYDFYLSYITKTIINAMPGTTKQTLTRQPCFRLFWGDVGVNRSTERRKGHRQQMMCRPHKCCSPPSQASYRAGATAQAMFEVPLLRQL